MTTSLRDQPIDAEMSSRGYGLALGLLIGAYWLSAVVYRPWQAAKPDLPTAHVRLASELAGVGRTAEAIDQCRAALSLAPSSVLARYNLAVYLRDDGQAAEAEAELRGLAQRAPQFAEAKLLLGTILAQRGDLAGAAQAWKAAGNHPAAQENLRRLEANPPK